MAGALAVLALSATACSSASSGSSASTSTSTPSSATRVTKVITASQPHKLLASILQFTTAIPTHELNFTYSIDPANNSWVYFKVNPKPAYVGHVQGGYGFAHFVDGEWQLAGPGNRAVGCSTSNSAVRQLVVPAEVFAQFGLKNPCASAPS